MRSEGTAVTEPMIIEKIKSFYGEIKTADKYTFC
jgi:hypothetical protein